MNVTISEITVPKLFDRWQRAWRAKILPLGGLAAILLLAAALRLAEINSLGYVNHYYAAAVKSMLQSWHNFFFVAAEPGSSVSVDKPPVGLWLQALSAYFLGVNTLGLLLPQILAGLGSVVLVFHLVKRSFGTPAGLLAALALAVTPVSVAVDRNNTIDSTLIFTLLLAAWAFLKATETCRFRYLLLGATLVGVAFNIKMLAAFLPAPAFFALYLLGARENFWRKIGQLTLTGLILLVVSFSWAVAVDLTAADQRPYVGSSSDNSEITLIVGYNGVNRLLGMARNRGLAAAGETSASGAPNPVTGNRQIGQASTAGNLPQSTGGQRPSGPPANPGGQPASGAANSNGNRPQAGGRGGGTPSNIGQAGPFRLFTSPLNKETSWLLPVGLVGFVLLAGSRWTWPLAPKTQVLVLWGGWLLTGGIFFSVASYFHEYYLALLAPPLAALAGIGLAKLWELRAARPFFGLGLALLTAGATLGFQIYIARAWVSSLAWQPLIFGLFLVGAVLLMLAAQNQLSRRLALAGFLLIVGSVYLTPAIWSVETALNPGSNLSLPAAYSGKTSSPTQRGTLQINPDLLAYLEANTQANSYLLAVPSSMQGADYVLASGRPVLYLGGFKGSDPVIEAAGLSEMVQTGELRYVYLSGGQGTQTGIATWVTANCSPVPGFETTTRNSGSPDGTSTAGVGTQTGQAISLYDCRN